MSRTTIVIEVERLSGDRGSVEVNVPDDTEFGIVMMAAEYLIHIVAQQSDAGYEKAMELLVQGAMTWKDA